MSEQSPLLSGNGVARYYSNVSTNTPFKCPACGKFVELISVNALPNGIELALHCQDHKGFKIEVTTGNTSIDLDFAKKWLIPQVPRTVK